MNFYPQFHFFFQTLMQYGIYDTRCLHGPFRICRFHKTHSSDDITDLLAPVKFGRIFDIFLPRRGKFGTGN